MLQLFVGLLLIVAGVALYVSLAATYTILFVVFAPWAYISALVTVLWTEPSPIPPLEDGANEDADALAPNDRLVAWPSYFYGTAVEDAWRAGHTAADRYVARFVTQGGRVLRWITTTEDPLAPWVVAAGAGTGIVAGGLVGLLVFTLVSIVHLVVTAVVLVMVRALGLALRQFDRLCRLVYGITSPACPACSRKVTPYPTYRCSSEGCNALHTDIRPGRLGFVHRVCRCGARLPTVAFAGARSMDALCPRCGAALPRGVGVTAEIVVAFIGSVGSGKTRLMYAMAHSLVNLTDESGDELEYLDDTEQRLKEIESSIDATGHTRKTPATSRPHAYGLRLRMRGGERLVYLFDAAGERNYLSETAKDLEYLNKARTMVLTIDPLAIERLWSTLPSRTRERLDQLRSESRMEMLAFDQTCEQLQRMGVPIRTVRLVLVVTKADVLEEGDGIHRKQAELERWVCDSDGLDLGDLVRGARHYFKDVMFFQTASVTDDEGVAHQSVEEIVRWMLHQEGVKIPRLARA